MRENTVLKPYVRYFFLLAFAASLVTGCSSYQPTKNVWKSTKAFWNTYVSPPATVDLEEKGTLSPQALSLTQSMMGIDVELTRLERVMLNADKPPTREWLTTFMTSFPWVSGFTGVKYDGTILGQEPANPLKHLDFIPLLYADKKQSTRALRADVQNTPLGPEVILAMPLYDGTDFLGVVATNFDMRSLMQYSKTPDNVVILSPQALLWPGKYDFAATPLAGVNWDEVTQKSTSGTCSNANGKFYFNVRFLGNVPLVFAVAESGNFPTGNGDVTQGIAFFPKDRPKLTPPPHEASKSQNRFEQGMQLDVSTEQAAGAPAPAVSGKPANGSDLQPGSHDSVLLKRKRAERRRVQERQLAGENVRVDHSSRKAPAGLGLAPDGDASTLPGGRPSPFGPKDDDTTAPAVDKTAAQPANSGSDKPAASGQGTSGPSAAEPPSTLPGGRISPFGPKDEKAAAPSTDQSAAPSASQPATAKAAGEGSTPSGSADNGKTAPATSGQENSGSSAPTPTDTLPGGRPSPFGPRN